MFADNKVKVKVRSERSMKKIIFFPFETFIDMYEQDDVATIGREQSAK